MKVSLITPPYHAGFVEMLGIWPNLGLLHIAGSLRKSGHEVFYLDAMALNLSHEDILKHIETYRPAAVGTFAWTAFISSSLKILQTAKGYNPEIITLLGGIHPHFCFKECLQDISVDFIIRGEGEATVPELLETVNNRGNLEKVKGIAFRKNGDVVLTDPRPKVDLDILEPAWDLVDFSVYRNLFKKLNIGGEETNSVYLDFSRGCPHQCLFCAQQEFWQRHWRSKKPARFVEEIQFLVSRYKVSTVVLPDELPTANREKWEEMLDRLIAIGSPVKLAFQTRSDNVFRDRDIIHKYKKAGAMDIFVGIESPNENRRRQLGKKISDEVNMEAIRLLRDHGIVTQSPFLIGMPDETPESIRQTLDRAKNYYNPDFAAFIYIVPWPYSQLYKEVEHSIVVKDYSKYNMTIPVIQPKAMSTEEMQSLVRECYVDFYRDKFRRWQQMEDGFLKKYLLTQLSCFTDQDGSFVFGILKS